MSIPTRNQNQPGPTTIGRITVDHLFGHHSYDLHPQNDDGGAVARLLILYGDNGSGKTTMAQLLFHLLSPKTLFGHRSFLARTRFRRFAVHFNNGASIAAERSADCLEGPYRIVAQLGGAEPIVVHISTSDDGSVKERDVDAKALDALFHSLSIPQLTLYFLSDSRTLQSDAFAQTEYEDMVRYQLATRKQRDTIVERASARFDTRPLSIDASIHRAESWMRHQALKASGAGEATTSTIYTDIITRLARTAQIPHPSAERDLRTLLAKLSAMAVKNADCASLGLTSPLTADSIERALKDVPQERMSLIGSVLEPYVNTVEARLNALTQLQRRLSTFLRIINTFYKWKAVRLTVDEGITVLDHIGERLEPALLSSGEKQLLLLLCNVLVATERPSIFVIDEPEISLNVKWQRALVDSLLELVDGSSVQFIMATHSIELLAHHRASVFRLDDINEEEKAGVAKTG